MSDDRDRWDGAGTLHEWDERNIRDAARELGVDEAEVRRQFREWDSELIAEVVTVEDPRHVWLTKDEAAAHPEVDCHPSTLDRAVARNELQSFWRGRVMFRLDLLLEWQANRDRLRRERAKRRREQGPLA